MRKWVLVLAVLALLGSSSLVLAKSDKNKKEPAPVPAAASAAVPAQQQLSPEETARQELIANITGMRNQEIRVAVLQQLLGEESAKLMNIQAVFCDRYKLDVEKWRNGLYRYDDKQAKFIEVPPAGK